MNRLFVVVALTITGTELHAQAVSAADSTAIVAAALTLTPKPDSSSLKPAIRLQGDTATVTVWLSYFKGPRVRVERRAGQWVGVKSDTTYIVLVRSTPDTARPRP